MKFCYAIISVVVFSICCFSQPVMGGLLTLDAVTQISLTGTPPEGTPPWITASFSDSGPGTVYLTLVTTNLTGSEIVSEWDINLDTSLNAADLVFTKTGSSGSFTNPTINLGANNYKADGDGYYDINFAFTTNGGTSTRFGVGDSVTYTITGISTLTAQSFNWLSNETNGSGNGGGGNGPYYMAAHVQSIGSGSLSGWVATPEPSVFILLVLGICGLALGFRR
jgi:hypothetical protein